MTYTRVSGSNLDVVSALKETTALASEVRGVEKGGAGIRKIDLYLCRICSVPF